MKYHPAFLLLALFLGGLTCHSQELSFENGCDPAFAGRGSAICVSKEHYKMENQSLRWTWKKAGAEIALKVPVPYLPENPDPKETSVSSFVFWAYSETCQDGKITVAFLKEGRECCHFDFNLGFTGWRGAWVAFDRDMAGTPEPGMDEVVFRSTTKKGTLWIDGVIPAVFEDIRHHSPDFQLPDVNKTTTSHWLLLLKHWNTESRLTLPESLPSDFAAQCETIRQRFIELVAGGAKKLSRSEVEEFRGRVINKPLFFVRYAETYLNLGIKDKAAEYKRNSQDIWSYTDMMFRIAASYLRTEDKADKEYFAKVYVELTRHLLDEGLACGSGMGTIHHLGYSIRGWYNAQVLMAPVLAEAGLLGEVQQALEWYSGAREVWTAPTGPGMDIDAFNTYLFGRIASVLLLPDDAYKYAYLKALSDWVDNGFRYAPGLGACFHPDGTVFHHRRNYPAYAVGGFSGAVRAVWLFRSTSFAISQEGHETLKNAMLQMRFYCNTVDVPWSMSGRHPEGSFRLTPYLYGLLADAGTPDGSLAIDPELAGAYLRLDSKGGKLAKKFAKAGFVPEKAPQGCRSYGYNSSVSVREGDWLVNIAGHSRYLWAAETYEKENLYGRYLTHGSLQYIKGSPTESGYVQEGWDWRHIPGTTAAVVPMEDMRSIVLNVDTFSGYEEMLLSDEWFAGGAADGRNAVYSMILHEHDKYNGSLRARKSWFVFGNRILCVGTGIENALPGVEVHTTLFQNAVKPGSSEKDGWLLDNNGNAYHVGKGDLVLTRGLQKSYYENDKGPNEGEFELAYINHGEGKVEGAGYEYLMVVQPGEDELETAGSSCRVLSSDNALHLVEDSESGLRAASVFEAGKVDESLPYASECVVIYDSNSIVFANPDLALYGGPSDEVFDENGKRVERSVYSRKWLDNPCGEVRVEFHVAGERKIASSTCKLESVEYKDGQTWLFALTSEAKTEKIIFE